MNDWGRPFYTRTKEERASQRHAMVKALMAAGHSRAVALKKAKAMCR